MKNTMLLAAMGALFATMAMAEDVSPQEGKPADAAAMEASPRQVQPATGCADAPEHQRARCQARVRVAEACKGRTGGELEACIRDGMDEEKAARAKR